MQNYQQCKQLDVVDLHRMIKEENETFDSLEYLMELQKDTQEEIYGVNFKEMQTKIGKVLAFIDWNENAIQDELRELVDAVTGIDTYPGHWKPWKSKHQEALERPLSALTEGELKELKMEWVDLLHFMFNIALAIGLTPKEVFNLYAAKNKENINRQRRPGGY